MTERDDLDRLAEQVDADPRARESYEDAAAREQLIQRFTAARGDTPQRQVADRMRTTQSAVSDLELGRVDPRLSTLQRFARAVGTRLRFELDDRDHEQAAAEHDARRLGDDFTLATMLADLVKSGRHGAESSEELADRIDLPPVTVGRMVARLEQSGWLDIDAHRGIRLNRERGAIVGVSLSGQRAHAVLTSLHPDEVHAQAELPITDGSPASVVDTVTRLVRRLRPSVPPGAELIGLGVSLAGLVEGGSGIVRFAPDLDRSGSRAIPGRSLWHRTPLGDDLWFATKLRTAVENDANSLAYHEYLVHPEEDDLVVILLSESGDGIGGGLVVNNEIVHGVGGVSAEIGHIVVDHEGLECRCGRARGCLETVASPNAIVTRIVGSQTDTPRDLGWVARLAEASDPDAIEQLRYAGLSLGRVLAHLTAIVGPPRVVVFGPAELVETERFASAVLFVKGVESGQAVAPFGIAPRLERRVLRPYPEAEAASAAAASALHYFVAKPREWVPGMLPDAIAEDRVPYVRSRNRHDSRRRTQTA